MNKNRREKPLSKEESGAKHHEIIIKRKKSQQKKPPLFLKIENLKRAAIAADGRTIIEPTYTRDIPSEGQSLGLP